MKAIIQSGYGPPEVLSLQDVARTEPGEGEVLVRVRAASLHPDIWHVVTGRPVVLRLMGAGLRRPRDLVPGTDLAGEVAGVGAGVTRFQVGDAVFGERLRGHQWRNGGTFAEYAAVPEETLAAKPPEVPFAQAAAVPTAGLIALLNLPKDRLVPGARVLVNGAAGGVGAMAVQVAKAHGATVTGVDHGSKLDLVRDLGADAQIDYTAQDATTGEDRYDLIFDVPGNWPFSRWQRVLSPDGRYVLIGHDQYGAVGGRWLGSLPKFFRLIAAAPFRRQLPGVNFSAPRKRELLAELARLLAEGTLRPVIDRTYPLAEVPEALRYLATGQARGRVVITV